ncbi:MAG: molybdopterin-dependent oxidoreductase, partial [Deltaproteobacteria bacterium]|nr:molybdopterin-dependent oxidoreductase [Deltaproteobacteria bacterium]
MAFNLTRRNFLKTASIAAASVPLSKVVAKAETGVAKAPLTQSGSFNDTQTVTGGICEMCFWRCQLVGKVRDGRLVKLEGNPKSIDNGAAICARGNAGIKMLYDPDKLKYPMKNVGKRGAPKWKRISWDEALDECAAKLKGVVDQYGPQGLAIFPHGASARYPMHFFERTVGTPNVSEASFFQCRGIRDMAFLYSFDTPPGENVDMANAKVIFLLGCHFGENVHVSHLKRYIKGLAGGAKLIVADPRFSASVAKADIWVKIKPGTDTAYLLAIMNYLIENDRYDKKFVDEHTVGFDQLAAGAEEWTLEKAAEECDIPAAQIKEVAEMLADNAPNVSIHPGRFVSWYGNDFQRERALACLTGLLGAVGVKGGFVKPKDPKVGRGKSWPHLNHEHGVGNLKEMAGLYPFSPPGTPTDLIRDCAVSGKPYPIKGCITWGQNPIQTIPNQKLTIDMLMQMDFILCVDVMPMDITMYADILLPECSYLERYDFIKRGTQWDLADKNQQQYISARMPLVEPGFECKSGIWITNEIAERMGYGEHIPVKNQEEMVNLMLKDADLSIEQLKKEDGIHLQPGKDPYGIPEDFEVLFYSEDIEDAGFSGVPKYIPVEEPPKDFFRLLFGRAPVHTFNRTMNNSWLMAAMGHNPVWVNDKVAAKL